MFRIVKSGFIACCLITILIYFTGVCHVDEIGYLFTTILTETPIPGSIEDITQRRMSRLWTNFAKYGNPTPVLDPLVQTVWKPITDANHVHFLDICEDLKMDSNPEHERMKFWDTIYTRGSMTSKL